MTAGEGQPQDLAEYRGPTMEVYAPGSIISYMITEQELLNLEGAVAQESTALGFMSLALGVFLSTLIAWLATEHVSPAARGVYLGTVLATGFVSALCGAMYYRARKARPQMITMLKSKSVRAKLVLVDQRSAS